MRGRYEQDRIAHATTLARSTALNRECCLLGTINGESSNLRALTRTGPALHILQSLQLCWVLTAKVVIEYVIWQAASMTKLRRTLKDLGARRLGHLYLTSASVST